MLFEGNIEKTGMKDLNVRPGASGAVFIPKKQLFKEQDHRPIA
jgi:hypothetical protein